jgi:hypothetical protein
VFRQGQRQRITVIAAIFMAAALIGTVVYYLIFYSVYSARLTLKIAPNDAVITMDGKRIKNEDQRIKPGDHMLRVEREGFEPQEKTFSVAKGETADILMALIPSGGDYQWYRDHPKDGMIWDGVATREQDAAMEEARNNHLILSRLPYTDDSNGLLYIIEGSYNDGLEFLVRLNTCAETSAVLYRDKALDWLTSQGIQPELYKMTYRTLCD